jgi:endonuclease
MRLLVARCSATYDGRLSSTLTSAVRLVMVKADGCVAIHADVGAYKPLNWMNAPNTWSRHATAGWSPTRRASASRSTSRRCSRTSSYELDTERGLTLDGVERSCRLLLADHPTTSRPGLTCVQREFRTDLGPVDLLCRDADGAGGRGRDQAHRGDRRGRAAHPLPRADAARPAARPGARVFAATTIKPQARVLAESRGIGWVEVDLGRCAARRTPPAAVLRLAGVTGGLRAEQRRSPRRCGQPAIAARVEASRDPGRVLRCHHATSGTRRRTGPVARLGVGAQQVAQVEVDVAAGTLVDVDVEQSGALAGWAASRPVSSRVSRTAASHGVSPGSR